MQCAERETLEETGLKVKGRKVAHVTNDVFSDLGKHYITIFVICEMLDEGAQPEVSFIIAPSSDHPILQLTEILP